jgi:hypothetical protein
VQGICHFIGLYPYHRLILHSIQSAIDLLCLQVKQRPDVTSLLPHVSRVIMQSHLVEDGCRAQWQNRSGRHMQAWGLHLPEIDQPCRAWATF